MEKHNLFNVMVTSPNASDFEIRNPEISLEFIAVNSRNNNNNKTYKLILNE